jgi:hypothetical protein
MRPPPRKKRTPQSRKHQKSEKNKLRVKNGVKQVKLALMRLQKRETAMKTFIVKFKDNTEMWFTIESKALLMSTLRMSNMINNVTKVTEVNNEQ